MELSCGSGSLIKEINEIAVQSTDAKANDNVCPANADEQTPINLNSLQEKCRFRYVDQDFKRNVQNLFER